jgi:hypothetical protein
MIEMTMKFLQINILRKLWLLVLAIPLVGCISSQPFPQGVVLTPPTPTPVMRAPKVGQEWVYQVRNIFNQEILDVVTEKVVSVGKEIRIARTGLKAGPLDDEIQSPWGHVIQDPHWKPAQKFEQAIPLWPEQLVPGWSGFYRTRYQVPGYPDSSYYWGLNIKAIEWERIAVPAGSFAVLHYQSEAPYFESNDLFRLANYRLDDYWLSPEIGRWVIRRDYGRYITAGVYWSNAYWEDYLQWELISWK